GRYDARTHTLSWQLSNVGGGETREVTAQLHAAVPGRFLLRAAGEAAGRTVLAAETELRAELDPASSSRALSNLIGAMDKDIARSLAAHADLLETPRPMPATGTAERYVVFQLGQADYAVPLRHVQAIGQPHAITPVPHVPDWVLGVANVRG